MITVKDVEEQRESIQDDLLCILEGLDKNTLNNVCAVVVDRMNLLVEKIKETEEDLDGITNMR